MNKPPSHLAAESIAATLREKGFQALLAGGCVRDLLLGREPKDYDVVTNATPDEVISLFRRSEQVGAKFGVIIVRLKGAAVEVATFRSEGPYSDGRRPDSVRFATAEEDARRRDFTINGMFMDPSDGRIIDLVGGREDLAAKRVRAIGDPERRFAEDHLRMLRAVRFAAGLGFEIDPGTLDAIRHHAPAIRDISSERTQQELEWILSSPGRRRGWDLLIETGLVKHVLAGTAWTPEPLAEAAERLTPLPPEADFMVAIAAVLVRFGSAHAARVCRGLRCSVVIEKGAAWLIEMLPRAMAAESLELADVKLLMADRRFTRLAQLVRAESVGVRRSSESYDKLMRRAGTIPPERVAPPPLVGGEDLQALNVAPGPIYGRVLDAAYRAQLNELLQTRQEALDLVQALVEKHSRDPDVHRESAEPRQ